MKQKWRNRTLQPGVVVDRQRGYVYVRFKRNGVTRKELIGRTTDVEAIDQANFRAQQLRATRRIGVPGFEGKRERILVEDAADLFLRLHGEQRTSRKGIKQFARYVTLIKAAWAGRYVDTITPDDLRRYRRDRLETARVSESTVNREHTAIVTLFNRLTEWRRSGQIAKGILLPEINPGHGVRKVNEDRFVRERLLSDAEYQRLWECADDQLRRIILAEMNLPLRLEDLKRLSRRNVNDKLAQLRGVQAKTGREYALPINAAIRGLIDTAVGDQILNFTGFVRRWRTAVKRAGLVGLQFRDLRRTAATTLHDGGVPLKTISVMLGHSAVTTTIRYLGLKEENLKSAGDLLASRYQSLSVTPAAKSVPESVPTQFENEVEKRSERIDLSTILAG
jgi:integrase